MQLGHKTGLFYNFFKKKTHDDKRTARFFVKLVKVLFSRTFEWLIA